MNPCIHPPSSQHPSIYPVSTIYLPSTHHLPTIHPPSTHHPPIQYSPFTHHPSTYPSIQYPPPIYPSSIHPSIQHPQFIHQPFTHHPPHLLSYLSLSLSPNSTIFPSTHLSICQSMCVYLSSTYHPPIDTHTHRYINKETQPHIQTVHTDACCFDLELTWFLPCLQLCKFYQPCHPKDGCSHTLPSLPTTAPRPSVPTPGCPYLSELWNSLDPSEAWRT